VTSPGHPPTNTTQMTRRPCRGVMTMVADLVRPDDSRTRQRRPARRTRSHPTTSDAAVPKRYPLAHWTDRAEFNVPLLAEADDRHRRAFVTKQSHWESGKAGQLHRLQIAQPWTKEPSADGSDLADPTPKYRDQSNPLGVWGIDEDLAEEPVRGDEPRIEEAGQARVEPFRVGLGLGSGSTAHWSRRRLGPSSDTGVGTVGPRNPTREWPRGGMPLAGPGDFR